MNRRKNRLRRRAAPFANRQIAAFPPCWSSLPFRAAPRRAELAAVAGATAAALSHSAAVRFSIGASVSNSAD